jgi:WD40 repeat protein/serine/threonine protein kinase
MDRCPTPERLEQLLEERLAGADFDSVSAHVAACRQCQEALERLTAGAARVSAAAPAPPDGPTSAFFSRLKQSPPPSASFSSSRLLGSDGLSSGQDRAPGPVTPPTVAGYEVLGELGRGGMGVVYKARQLGLNRLVALKMILAGRHAGPKELARFRQEAEAAARLHHPNIVQIFDIGEAEGAPYIALELVEGGSLVRRLRGDPQPVQPAARLVETLARAIHYAHRQGIVHRDLKPANVLLAQSRQAAGDGAAPRHRRLDEVVPKVTDFGLAKRLDEPGPGTHTGEVVGTPSYMAPEQAGDRGKPVGPASDVYALGAILYELLTGRPPFKAATPLDTVLQVLHEEPVPPRRLQPGVPRDLETVCLKCLQKEPARRYGSAEALADDLRRFRHNVPVRARPVGPRERLWKWARRRPLTAGLVAGLVLITLLGFAGVTWQWQEARRAWATALAERDEKETQRLHAESARSAADKARQQTRSALYYSRIAQSQLQWRVNDFASAERTLGKVRADANQLDRRGWEWHYLNGLFHCDLLTLGHARGGEGGGVAFRPDGKQLAAVVGDSRPGEGGRAGEVRVWEAGSGTLRHAVTVPAGLHRLAYSPDGARLALAGTDGSLVVWDADTCEELLRRSHGGPVAAVTFSPDGKRLATAGWDRVVKVWSAAGEVLQTLQGHKGKVYAVAFSPDGKLLATGSEDNTVKLWDAETGRELHALSRHKSAVYGVAFSPDGKLLATAGSNGNLKIWEVAPRQAIQSLTGNTGAVLSIAFSPDGRYLAFCGSDSTVRAWDVESGTYRVIYRGHSAPVECVGFSPGGGRLVSCSPGQGVVKVWDFTRHPEYATVAHTRKDVEALAFAPGGRIVSLAGGRLQTWDAASGLLWEERSLPVREDLLSPAVLASFSPGGARVAARAREDARVVKAWDVTSGAEAVAFRGHRLPVCCVRYSPDGRLLATCACDLAAAARPQEVKVWDAVTGQALFAREGQGRPFSVAFGPAGRLLALGGEDGTIAVLEWATGDVRLQVDGHKGGVTAVAFSDDGAWLASGGAADRTVKVWGLASGARPAHTLAAPAPICDLAFSPDGKRLAGTSRDVVRLWDPERDQEVLTLRGAPQRFWDPPFNPRVAFSPDGQRLAASNWNESISVWEAEAQTPDRRDARRRAAAEGARSWHLQEAEHCLEHEKPEHNNPAAAAFHLRRVGNAPLPGPLQALRERLTQELERAGQKRP